MQYFKSLRFWQDFRERFYRRFPMSLIMLFCITLISGESAYISNFKEFLQFQTPRTHVYGYL